MSMPSQADLDCTGVSFAPQCAEILHEGGEMDLRTESCEYDPSLQLPPRSGVSAIHLAASSAASLWQPDDPMPAVAEFFRVLKHCWRRC